MFKPKNPMANEFMPQHNFKRLTLVLPFWHTILIQPILGHCMIL